MDITLANDIKKILPDDRTLFRYHKDRYAFMLLEYAMKDGMSVADIKASRFAKLLERPAVKDLMAQRGGGKLTAHDMALCWPIETQSYVLSLGLWGSRKSKERDWHQTSRTGVNLVLQMNFDRSHDAAFQKLLGDQGYGHLACQLHPINRKGRTTMAWARIDLDLDSGEALIEEIQNDWLRNALWELDCVEKIDANNQRQKNLERYVHEHLQPHVKIWSEAMLAATLFFLIKEIGIRDVWLHDFETGNRLKQLRWSKPPRSLYTSLPKRFCFEKVKQAPSFLSQSVTRKMRKRLNDGKERFWKLAV